MREREKGSPWRTFVFILKNWPNLSVFILLAKCEYVSEVIFMIGTFTLWLCSVFSWICNLYSRMPYYLQSIEVKLIFFSRMSRLSLGLGLLYGDDRELKNFACSGNCWYSNECFILSYSSFEKILDTDGSIVSSSVSTTFSWMKSKMISEFFQCVFLESC